MTKTLKEIERDAIIEALKEYKNNRTQTATALGISIRSLRTKIIEYREQGFDVPDRPWGCTYYFKGEKVRERGGREEDGEDEKGY